MNRSRSHRFTIVTVALLVLLVALVALNLLCGSVDIESSAVWKILTGGSSGNTAWDTIILQSRVPMILTALLAGAALAISGLLLQTTFNNPLAGPSILGVSSGAGLGVAVIMLALGGNVGSVFGASVGSYIATLLGAFAGAALVLVILIVFSSIVRSSTMLLIVGILVSYLTSSVVQLLNSVATEEGVHNNIACAVVLRSVPYCCMVVDTYDERIVEHKTYPWAGSSVRSANKKYYGQFLANFKRSRGDAMGVAGNLNDGWDYTCPVKWYFPNDYGLYNMAGNVSEWCMDVYRKDQNPVGGEDQNPFRGNVYRTPTYIDEEIAINDTTGSIIYKNVDDDLNRRNYRQADNINYLDGDYASNIYDYRPTTRASPNGSTIRTMTRRLAPIWARTMPSPIPTA